MISAFGVEHGEISKGLKPENMAALKRVSNSGAPPLDGNFSRNFKNQMYAGDKVRLRGFKDLGDGTHKGPLPIMADYHKKGMGRLTRTRRSERDKNRKPIFGDSTKAQ